LNTSSSYWQGSNAADAAIHQVTGVVSIQGDSVTAHYSSVAGVEPAKMDSFDIPYRMVGQVWVASDSAAFKKYW